MLMFGFLLMLIGISGMMYCFVRIFYLTGEMQAKLKEMDGPLDNMEKHLDNMQSDVKRITGKYLK